MKATVWCQRDINNWDSRGFEVWSGEIDFFPRPGDLITVFDGWCAEEIKRSFYDLETKKISIEIRPDISGEYAREIERRKPKPASGGEK